MHKQSGSPLDPLWFKDAIIYQVHVRAFFDSNDDGIGDFPGLTRKLDYLQNLGVSCIWLLPFYPSPLKDDGYDIAHYVGVHPSYGTLRDFRTFLREAHARGLQVVTELVINHTSDQHPWFQAARRAPAGSSKRNFYVWSDVKDRYDGARIIFTDTETSNWTWDPEAGAYYWHRFFRHQPDLNFDNPNVRRAVVRVMRFWLDMGVDGLRLDAVPYLIERDGTNCENLPETHAILKAVRAELDARYHARMLLAEANQWPADVRPYFGDGDEAHMAFHFPLMPRIFMALRQEDRHPITEIMRQTPDIPDSCQWALFLRNHDELTLEMVTDEERDYMYGAYAADPQMRLNMGIRRRLAPLMENNRQRIQLLTSLLFSMPGTPVLYYGDEIGMGDNIYLGDRNGVRTPMQWTGDRNAGFSRADPARLFAPPIMDLVYGYQAINVEAEERSPFSLLNWTKRMIALRKQHQTFGRGTIDFLFPRNRKVLAYVRRYGDEIILAVVNLARTVQPAELDLSEFNGYVPLEMLGQTEFPKIGDLPYFLTLGPYSFYWFALQRQSSPLLIQRTTPVGELSEVEAMPPLLVGTAWDQMLDGNVRALIERQLLVDFLGRQRWFGGKARSPRSARLRDWAVLAGGLRPSFLTLVDVEYEDGAERYFVPLSAHGEEIVEWVSAGEPDQVLARIAGARKGLLHDVLNHGLAHQLFDGFRHQRELPTRLGRITWRTSPAFAGLAGPDPETLTVTAGSREQSNTSVDFGGRVMLKLFRRVEAGPNPEVEVLEYLHDHSAFTQVPRLAGLMAYEAAEGGESSHLGLLVEHVPHQLNGWEHAVEEIGRYYEGVISGAHHLPPDVAAPWTPTFPTDVIVLPDVVLDTVAGYLTTAATLGRRTAGLHLALGQPSENPDFGRDSLTPEAIAELAADLHRRGEDTLDRLARGLDQLPEGGRGEAAALLARRTELVGMFHDLAAGVREETLLIRIHGDYHLGQVLWNEGDVVIIDFEGEPARPVGERRRRASPFRDVAGMVRSFSYAAHAGLLGHTLTRPSEYEGLLPWADVWAAWVSRVFLGSYLLDADHGSFLPAAPDTINALLRLFVLEKAFYELNYELNNRPEWVRIPIRGLLQLLPSLDLEQPTPTGG